MDIKVLKSEKEEMLLEVDNLTILELLRVYLNKDSNVEFVAWKREHSTKNPVLKVKTKGKTAKKAVNDAIAQVLKEIEKIGSDFKNMK